MEVVLDWLEYSVFEALMSFVYSQELDACLERGDGRAGGGPSLEWTFRLLDAAERLRLEPLFLHVAGPYVVCRSRGPSWLHLLHSGA